MIYNRFVLLIVPIIIFGGISSPRYVTAAVDKSGVKPSVLSLPSGPGSLEGLGESFEPQLNTGTAAYQVKLQTPPGRAGFDPDISLSYNSGGGNGCFGLGWKLGIPYLQRQTDKGLPYYTDWPNGDGVDNDHDGETDEPDEFDTIQYSNGEELVYTADGSFRCENEGEFIRFTRSTSGWIAKRKDGVTLKFGTTSESRIQDTNDRIFMWLLEEMTDTNGNSIRFTYKELDSTSPQRYCTEINYNFSGTRSMSIVFDYELRPDIIVDYRPRFQLKTAYRCKKIKMLEGGNSVRSYDLAYEPTSDIQPLSLLSSVIQFGRDEKSALPPASFTYTQFHGDSAQPVSMPTAPKLTLNDGNIDIIDLNADGLPDILDTNEGRPHTCYLNQGQGQGGEVKWAKGSDTTSPAILYLGSDDTQLADMDGDGHTDLMELYSSEVQVYKIKETASGLAWEASKLISQAEFNFQNPNIKLVDINNDKLIDVIRTNTTDYYAWLNLKDGRWSHPFVASSPNSQATFDRSYIHFADMNGDRLQDIVWLQDDICLYYPNKGFGEFDAPITMENPPFSNGDEKHLIMADVNGDGMSDVIYVGFSKVSVWINLGISPKDHKKGRFADFFTVSAPYNDSSTTFRQADMNGNGSTDILWNTYPGGGGETFAYLDFSMGEQPYQLKTITNGIGRTIAVYYRSSVEDMVRDRDVGMPWQKGLPFPVPVIAKIEVNDGITTYTTDYEYHNGYYDGNKKEFRGFKQVEKHEIGEDTTAPDLITAYTYSTGEEEESLKGKPLALEARTVLGEVFYRENYTWGTRTVATGINGDIRKVTFPFQTVKTRDISEKGTGTPVQLKWEYGYDDYGNMTLQKEYGRMDSDWDWDDERVTMGTYTAQFASGQSNWILDKVVESKTTDENDKTYAHKRNYYDGLGLGEISKGNLTKVEDWVRENTSFITSVQNKYDDSGNIIAMYDPLYGKEPGHYRRIDYDSTYHTFPVEENIFTGALTLTMSATYDAGWGVMKSSTDYNGYTTTYDYDTFGRLTSITKPPDTGHTIEYDYKLAQPVGTATVTDTDTGTGTVKVINWVETRQRDDSPGDGFLRSRTFYDGMGRKIMTRSEGEDADQVVVTDTIQFNARKLPWRKYLPYFDGGSLDFVEPTFNTGFTEHFYDALGREIRVRQPVGPDGIVYAETTYKPLEKIVRDEEQTKSGSIHEGNGMRYVTDGLLDKDGNGRLREVFEMVKLSDKGEPIDNQVEWKTTYSYDLLDNLTGYVDSQNNTKTMTYDGLKRKVSMDDPDRGHMEYTYDDASNLIKTIDAKKQVIRYEYDGVNRLTAEYYGADKTEPDVEYHYDMPGDPVNMGDLWQHNQAKVIADVILNGGVSSQPPESPFAKGDRPHKSPFVKGDMGVVPFVKGDVHPLPPPAGDINNLSIYDLNNDEKLDVADVVKAARVFPQNDTITAENTKGFLSWVRDQSGEEHNSYDSRGRVKWVVKGINRTYINREGTTEQKQPPNSPFIKGDFLSPAGGGRGWISPLIKGDLGGCKTIPAQKNSLQPDTTRYFYTGMEYDSMDRITRLVYPDGTFVNYAYNSRGLLESVPGVIKHYDYNPSGQNKELEIAGGTITKYDYDHRLRLSRFATTRSRDGLTLQDLKYTYDGVSNITRIDDGRGNAALDKIGAELGVGTIDARKFNVTQSFIYDSLYRLTQATNPDVYGTINHRYDRIGNMIQQNAALLDPDPLMNLGMMTSGGTAGSWNREVKKPNEAGPHAITSTEKGPNGALIFTYDDNGNMENDRGTDLNWDYKDRLISLTNGTITAQYVYDYTDARKRKLVNDAVKGSESEVLYIDKLSEVRGGKLVKYIYAGSNRVARSEDLQNTSLATQPSTFYLHDHLGSTNITLTNNATVAEQMVNYPFGHERYAKRSNPSARLADYKFTGKETDDESGLQYFEARYLGSYLGRFISVDPLAENLQADWLILPQKHNIYAFCRSNPVTFTDLTGNDEAQAEKLMKEILNAQQTVGMESDTKCNLGVQKIQAGMEEEVVTGKANEMYNKFLEGTKKDNPTYQIVSAEVAKAMAEKGYLVVAARKKQPTETNGHVAVVSPKSVTKEIKTEFRGARGPMIGNVGKSTTTGDKPVNYVFGSKDGKPGPTYFVSTKTMNQYKAEIAHEKPMPNFK